MTKEQYLKWFIELANQEYNGNIQSLLNEVSK